MANSHTKEQQEFIVRKIAARVPPREIALDFLAIFPGTKCDEMDVRRLNPSNVILSPELHALFLKERERIKNDPDAAPYADQMERLRVLSRDVDALYANNQGGHARQVLRQIAEEVGAIGTKGGKAVTPADEAEAEKVVAITRTIVDPKVKESNEQPDRQPKQE